MVARGKAVNCAMERCAPYFRYRSFRSSIKWELVLKKWEVFATILRVLRKKKIFKIKYITLWAAELIFKSQKKWKRNVICLGTQLIVRQLQELRTLQEEPECSLPLSVRLMSCKSVGMLIYLNIYMCFCPCELAQHFLTVCQLSWVSQGKRKWRKG